MSVTLCMHLALTIITGGKIWNVISLHMVDRVNRYWRASHVKDELSEHASAFIRFITGAQKQKAEIICFTNGGRPHWGRGFDYTLIRPIPSFPQELTIYICAGSLSLDSMSKINHLGGSFTPIKAEEFSNTNRILSIKSAPYSKNLSKPHMRQTVILSLLQFGKMPTHPHYNSGLGFGSNKCFCNQWAPR